MSSKRDGEPSAADGHKRARSELMTNVGGGGGSAAAAAKARKPVITTCKSLRSLRCALKSIYTESDDTRPAMIMPVVEHRAMPAGTQYGVGIPIVDTATPAEGSLNALMTTPRTVLIVQDFNRVGTRFATWRIPCGTIHNLEKWPPDARWFVNPQDLITMLKEYDSVKATVRFDERHVTFSFRETSNRSCGRLAFKTCDCDDQLTNPYTKMAVERVVLSVRMTATDMLRKLKTLAVQKSSAFRVQLHDLKMGTVHTQAITFSGDDADITIGYINEVDDPTDPVMNFRRSGGKKKAAAVDDDSDAMGAAADAEIAAAEALADETGEDDLDKYIRWSERYRGALRSRKEVKQYGDWYRDLHTVLREQYRLILDQTFSITELLAMFKEIVNDLPSGISIPLCGDSDNRCLTIVTPLADGTIGVHRIMAKDTGEDDDDFDEDDDDYGGDD